MSITPAVPTSAILNHLADYSKQLKNDFRTTSLTNADTVQALWKKTIEELKHQNQMVDGYWLPNTQEQISFRIEKLENKVSQFHKGIALKAEMDRLAKETLSDKSAEEIAALTKQMSELLETECAYHPFSKELLLEGAKHHQTLLEALENATTRAFDPFRASVQSPRQVLTRTISGVPCSADGLPMTPPSKETLDLLGEIVQPSENTYLPNAYPPKIINFAQR